MRRYVDIKERLISIFPVCHVYEVVVSDNINCTYVAKFAEHPFLTLFILSG